MAELIFKGEEIFSTASRMLREMRTIELSSVGKHVLHTGQFMLYGWCHVTGSPVGSVQVFLRSDGLLLSVTFLEINVQKFIYHPSSWQKQFPQDLPVTQSCVLTHPFQEDNVQVVFCFFWELLVSSPLDPSMFSNW